MSDPSLAWYTIETPHFRVTYHSGIEEVANHVASVAESIHSNMAAHVGWEPKEPVDILLTDSSESANGFSTALPYNAIQLWVTAPEDLSPLGDVDDWYLELVTHEYTHILHTDQIRGLPAIVNAVLGKTLAPNQAQPRWILEGLAVYQESARTSGGRLRASQWDMWMRADVLSGNIAAIDQISNSVQRWPQGNIWYLYGSYFTQWIASTYGEQALREAAADYGSQIIPYGFNRSIRRATGNSYVELYSAWVSDMQRKYRAQAAEVKATGQREGVRITHHGQIARSPRWIPKGTWPEHEGGLLYYREDENLRTGLWALPIRPSTHGARDARNAMVAFDESRADLIARTSGESQASFTPDGDIVFSSENFDKNVFLYTTLERLQRHEKSTFGTQDRGRTVLTDPSLRASDPAVSPNGRRIVYVRNSHGTRSIMMADLERNHLAHERPLVPTARFEQAYTPRWSPDGKHVSYSIWKHGGFRDVRYVDVENGSFVDITSDRAIDGGPSFSPDGRFVYFHSDRSGISNIYAWEINTNRILQVTNVVLGAYSPEPSPDGKTLAYVGYTKDGFDLFAMPIDESTWTVAPAYIDNHPTAHAVPNKTWKTVPYSPWRTLWPRRYGVQITPGNFGQQVIITASSTDISGFHTMAASTTTEIERPNLQGSLAYTYARLPFDFSMSLFRTVTPRGGFSIGSYQPEIMQEVIGFSSSIAYTRNSPYDSNSFVVTHSLARVGIDRSFPIDKIDPYETPTVPRGGLASTLHLGYAYTNAERYLYSVGAERGLSFSTSLDVSDPSLGGDFSGFAVQGNFSTYFLMPWLRHHSLALHAGGGTSGGSFPGQGAFYVGGFVDLPIVDTVRNVLIQGGITLRGYPSVIEAGRSYVLSNAEYRFPILNVDRGPETLPIFLNRVTGAVFLDYGSAFDEFNAAKFKTGAGGELWFDSTLGYIEAFTFRLGYAKGLASGGINKVYFVAAVPY
jgi:Tol biopolymer transport system component